MQKGAVVKKCNCFRNSFVFKGLISLLMVDSVPRPNVQ